MEIKVAPHPSDHDECNWVKKVEVPCLPPIGAHFTVTKDEKRPMIGFVSMHLFDASGEVVVKVELFTHNTDSIEKVCSSTPGWEEY